jgi:uncharacterized protein YbjT (DUF2867 family)
MDQKISTVVFGATGVQGGAVARRLARKSGGVRGLGRSRAALDKLAGCGVKPFELRGSGAATLDEALEGAAAAFVCVPITAGLSSDELSGFRKSIRDALERSSIKRVVWTSSWLVTERGSNVSRSFDEVRRAIDLALDLPIEMVVLKPGGYLDNLLTPESIAAICGGTIPYMLPEDLVYRWISSDDQARLVEAILARDAVISGEYAIGERVTGLQLAHAASDALGRSVSYTAISPRQFADQWRGQIGNAADRIAADYLDIAAYPKELGLDADATAVCSEFDFQYTGLRDFFADQAERLAVSR